ncbi:MAG: CPBP family intramembrane metalloprotease [Bacteroidetes bacterium]|uniref:CPBP family intramembrane glutamic endopeptidase n=1 Tax=Flavobacterium sp. TaxID=239 RepID=UPI003FA52E1E|nr:CPBP family intramembrane metalloprotease [Bacteroidota bacterium]
MDGNLKPTRYIRAIIFFLLYYCVLSLLYYVATTFFYDKPKYINLIVFASLFIIELSFVFFLKLSIFNVILKIRLVLIYFTVGILLGFLNSILSKSQFIDFGSRINDDSFLPVFLSIVILSPIVEELYYRYFIFERVLKTTPLNISIIFSSVLFSLIHLKFDNMSLSLISLIKPFILGVILCFVFKKHKNIVYCIVMHIAYNIIWFIT